MVSSLSWAVGLVSGAVVSSSAIPRDAGSGLSSSSVSLANRSAPAVGYEDCGWNSTSGIHHECMEVLKLSDHLKDWWTANQSKCGDKGFARCYIDSAGLITWNCDVLSMNTCTPPPSGLSARYNSFQEFYVIWNIYAINQFFSTYHQALLNGQAEAIGVVGKIIQVVAPPKTKNRATPLFGAIFGPAIALFAGLPAIAPTALVGLLMGTMVGLSAGTPVGMAWLFFPKKDMVEVPWEGMQEALSVFVNDYQKNIGAAVTQVLHNFDYFLQLTANGAFCSRITDALPDKTDFLYRELVKWVFNQALQARSYFSIKNPGVDPMELEKTNKHFKCGGYDRHNLCKDNPYIWYDAVHGDAYGMARAKDVGADFFPNLLKTAFDNGWTTPEELYLDAQDCAFVEPGGQFDAARLDSRCASNTPVCVTDMTVNLHSVLGSRNPGSMFENCPPIRGWGIDQLNDKVYIPFSYLGPLSYAKEIVHNENIV